MLCNYLSLKDLSCSVTVLENGLITTVFNNHLKLGVGVYHLWLSIMMKMWMVGDLWENIQSVDVINYEGG